eukprot:CAMPEP_0184023956 /NCGR_PEP_ID=MMETSP0954-20121128/11727_1 /TAXON_ID=627963 /ORGANISM="Aplanochytrium sp, Strain PBS07" /LENGTH=401 /DNA_ID=CAMNT_0026307055 /DNA_START=111 /DNA_END=1316 /DNA_ORIENTATION=+
MTEQAHDQAPPEQKETKAPETEENSNETLSGDGDAKQEKEGVEKEGVEKEGGRQHHENLQSQFVTFSKKNYYLDVRENAIGKYLKLTEVNLQSQKRSTILLSPAVLNTVQKILGNAIEKKYASTSDKDELDSNWVTIASERIQTSQKNIYVDVMQNARGMSIHIAELHSRRPKTSVLISDKGWSKFKEALDRIVSEFPEFDSKNAVPANSQSQNRSNSNGQKKENGGDMKKRSEGKKEPGDFEAKPALLDSKKITVGGRRFFFDFMENAQGRYLKVAEVKRTKREVIRFPKHVLSIFAELVESFTKEDHDCEIQGVEELELPDKDTEHHSTLASRRIELEKFKECSDFDVGRYYNIDLRENRHGKFLRVCEHRESRSDCVFFPYDTFQEVVEIFQGFEKLE